ncbi:MAG: sodium:proton antiporter, partial [Variovorax sp.]|nr:sodium:proton antiporter [Variovorax sp.]
VLRDLALVGVIVASLKLTPRKVRTDNTFTWGPMAEVAKLFAGIFVTIAPAVTFLAVPVAVESVEQREQDDDAEQHLAEQMLGRPEEAHTFQEAQEQRWIAEWRQGTADVRHQKDEEHEDMDLVSPVVVGADDRPDQQHRRAGGTHPAGQYGADREQGRVHRRRTVEVAADMDAARDDEQGSKQHDEGDVVQQC